MFFKSYSMNHAIVLMVTLGFLFLLADTIIEHQDLLLKVQFTYIPIVVSLVGFIIAFLTVRHWQESYIRVLHFYLMVIILVGIFGLFIHNQERFEGEKQQTTTMTEENENDKIEPPILAPTAFIGLGMIGLLGTSRKRQAEIRQRQ